MSYPTILQYIESLSNPEALFTTIGDLSLVLNNNDEPIYSSGSFGTVFKIELREQIKAIKCFTREQVGRKTAYKNISENFKDSSGHSVKFDYLDNEIGVFHDDGTFLRYPVILMDWVEGETLESAIHRAAIMLDKQALFELSEKFDNFAKWLLCQPFAHGDLKPENIIINNDGQIVLVDYDGMFLPNMECESQREIGTCGYQHPLRWQMLMCKQIDDYSIAMLSVTLKVLSHYPQYYMQYGGGAMPIFNPIDILAGNDVCYNALKKSDIGKTALFEVLANPTPYIDSLELMLGDVVVPMVDPVVVFEGLKRVKIGHKYGFANDANDVVIEAKYDAAREFVGGYAAVCLRRRWGVVDREGKSVTPMIYDQVRDLCEGFFAVSVFGKWGYVSPDGRGVIPIKYENAWSFRCGRGLVKRGGKYGFVDHSGKLVVPIGFEYAQSYVENYACVKKNGLYGYLDLDGRWAQLPIFSFAQSVHNGRARVEKDDQLIEIVIKEKITSAKKLLKMLSEQK